MPTNEELLEGLAAIKKNGGNMSKAAEEIGRPRTTLIGWPGLAARRGLTLNPPIDVPPGFEIKQISANDEGEVTNVKMRQAAGEAWECPEGFSITNRSVRLDSEGRIEGEWAKIARDKSEASLEAIREAFSTVAKVPKIKPPAVADADLLNVIPVADPHLRQLSWGRETGEDYDLEIAQRTMLDLIGGLAKRVPPAREALLLILGDYLHANDRQNMTPASKHILDTDGRHHKAMFAAAYSARDAVAILAREHQQVRVKVLPGNHDEDAYVGVLIGLEMAFADHENVVVDTSPGYHYFYEFGQNLIGATHGHTIKQKDAPSLFLAEAKEALGRTKFHHLYSGHIHHQKQIEVAGINCRAFPALAARDAYAASKGYNSHRGLIAITHHRERGPYSEVSQFL